MKQWITLTNLSDYLTHFVHKRTILRGSSSSMKYFIVLSSFQRALQALTFMKNENQKDKREWRKKIDKRERKHFASHSSLQ